MFICLGCVAEGLFVCLVWCMVGWVGVVFDLFVAVLFCWVLFGCGLAVLRLLLACAWCLV